MDNTNAADSTKNSNLIGVIGSPSSTVDIEIDILGTAVQRKLIGELAYFEYIQDGNPHYAIGQITEVSLNNTMLEDSTMRSLVREKGTIETISGLQDTHRGRLTISAVFGSENGNYFPSLLGTVPPSGTPVTLIDDTFLDSLLGRYLGEIFYLGQVYGSTPRMPLWFKHFGRGENGAGEAYHIGVFGKSGSGKSVLARMLLLAYARHAEMTTYIIDPQGEFAMDLKGEIKNQGFDLRMRQLVNSFQKEVIVKDIGELVLQGWPLFTEVLRESNFFPKIGIKKQDEKVIASEDITRAMRGRFKTTELVSEEAFFEAFKLMGSESSNERLKKIFKDFSYSKEKFNALYVTSWKPVCELFRNREGAITIEKMLQQTFSSQQKKRPIVVIDLSASNMKGIYWSETIQALAIKSLLDFLKNTAEFSYRNNQFLNTLVILDEAHRLAPSEERENEAMENVRLTLIDAVRTTRKYGLGWLFISQTLASLPKEIVEQMRIMFFGFGLAFGKEFAALSELAGGDDESNSLKLYQSFRDPHSAFDSKSKQYNFMSIGPVSPLSFAGTPLFFMAYNDPIEFFKVNRLVKTTK